MFIYWCFYDFTGVFSRGICIILLEKHLQSLGFVVECLKKELIKRFSAGNDVIKNNNNGNNQ